jgi:NAD+ synthase
VPRDLGEPAGARAARGRGLSDLRPRLPAHAADTIARFLRSQVREAGARAVVVGLSGGIDSALVARLCADALGPKSVVGVLLPDAAHPTALLEETTAYAQALGVETVLRPIGEVERAFDSLLQQGDDVVGRGNVKARIRMTVLYAEARRRGALVVGTGNKSEILTGYFTKFGDGGADLLPLGDLYKTELRELARRLELPAPFLERAPTAGLWAGQTDEAELGVSYDVLDQILRGLEELHPEAQIAEALGVDPATVAAVVHRVAQHRHKRRLPPIPKLSLRTVGLDWRD